jgi:NitT/TauT family transport system ATP-binding protein
LASVVGSGGTGPDPSEQPPPLVELHGVAKRYRAPDGRARTALGEIDLTVEPGRFCALIGPTGCGKSTVLSLVAGLAQPSEGSILMDGAPVRGTDPRIGFVFQNDAVFPWKTVLANVAAGPRFRGAGRRESAERARDWLRRVGLAGFEHYFPHQLSGGMRKRVALAQTFINEPRILLLDEPFSGLDAQTRQIMSDELLGLWEGLGATVLMVTHDLEEAVALADSVVVLTAGPATVKKQFAVDLPRPRRVREIRFQPRFTELHEQIWSCLSEEVAIAYDRATTAA